MKPKFALFNAIGPMAGTVSEQHKRRNSPVLRLFSGAAGSAVADSALARQLPTRQRQRFVDRLGLHAWLCVRLFAIARARSTRINLLFVRHSNSLSSSTHLLPLLTRGFVFPIWDPASHRNTLVPGANRASDSGQPRFLLGQRTLSLVRNEQVRTLHPRQAPAMR